MYGVNPKEDYFSKLEKIKNTDHNKRFRSSKAGSVKGGMGPKRYKSAAAIAVKANLSKIKNKK